MSGSFIPPTVSVSEAVILQSAINIGTNDYTATAWIKANSTQVDGFGGILASTESFAPSVPIPIYLRTSDGLLRSYMGFGFSPGIVDLRDNAWHHVAISFDRSGNAAFYIDGSPDGVTDISSESGVSLSLNTPQIGRYIFSGPSFNGFTGEIAEVAIWVGSALSASQILQLYAGGIVSWVPLTVDPGNLQGYWSLIGTAGATITASKIIDLSNNGHDGSSVVETPTFEADPRSVLGAGPLIVQAPPVVVGGPFPHYIRRRQRGGMIGMGV